MRVYVFHYLQNEHLFTMFLEFEHGKWFLKLFRKMFSKVLLFPDISTLDHIVRDPPQESQTSDIRFFQPFCNNICQLLPFFVANEIHCADGHLTSILLDEYAGETFQEFVDDCVIGRLLYLMHILITCHPHVQQVLCFLNLMFIIIAFDQFSQLFRVAGVLTFFKDFIDSDPLLFWLSVNHVLL